MPLPREIEVEPRRAFILERDTRSQEFTSSSFFTLFQKFYCVPWRKSLAEEKKLEIVTTWKLYKDENHRMSRMAPRSGKRHDVEEKSSNRVARSSVHDTVNFVSNINLFVEKKNNSFLPEKEQNCCSFIYLFVSVHPNCEPPRYSIWKSKQTD